MHIKVVFDMSSEAFMAALHRFIFRKGVPSDIYSDCGTNFKGANQQLQRTFSKICSQTTYTNTIPCTWHSNPPTVPHFGEIWEAAVKSTKYHMK